MSEFREPAFDRTVALVLRVGAFGCFFVMLGGLLIGLFVHGRISPDLERAGVLLMLATPVVPRPGCRNSLSARKRLEVWRNLVWSAHHSPAGGPFRHRRTLRKKKD